MTELGSLSVILKPLFSEKSNNITQFGQYAFRVSTAANKKQIARAVAELFKVEVASVTTVKVRGKAKRHGRFIGRRASWKKAYVQLEKGHSIDVSGASA